MLTKDTIANIVIRHWPIKQHGTGAGAIKLMKQDFEDAIDHWFAFAIAHQTSAKELIRILQAKRKHDEQH